MASTDEYLLGHTAREWNRLEEQHDLWGPVLLGDLRSLGIGAGHAVLEVGCGTGALLEDLTELTGRAEGLELDPASAAHAAARGLAARPGNLLHDDLGGPWDVVVARWVLSFLPDAAAAVARMRDALAPGGRLVVFDYNHDGLAVWPRRPAIDRVVEAYRAAYAANGGDLWVGATLPGVFRAQGLREVEVRPHVMAGAPRSAAWRWVERFVLEHLPTLVTGGQLSEAEADAVRDAWAEARADPASTLFSPLLVTVSGER